MTATSVQTTNATKQRVSVANYKLKYVHNFTTVEVILK